MTRRYTAADFANARFAELGKHGLRAHKSAGDSYWQRDGIKRATNEEMAAAGWVPVPTKPTITESEHRLALDEGRGPQYAYGFTAAMCLFGGEVIPDPEPTNKEKWVTFLRKVNPDSVMIDDYAEAIVAAGVTPPNSKGN